LSKTIKIMETNVSFISPKHYDINNINQWMFHFHTYKNIKGFIFRMFGIYFNVREKNSTEKLIQIWRAKYETKKV
jgi:hypothetical protein